MFRYSSAFPFTVHRYPICALITSLYIPSTFHAPSALALGDLDERNPCVYHPGTSLFYLIQQLCGYSIIDPLLLSTLLMLKFENFVALVSCIVTKATWKHFEVQRFRSSSIALCHFLLHDLELLWVIQSFDCEVPHILSLSKVRVGITEDSRDHPVFFQHATLRLGINASVKEGDFNDDWSLINLLRLSVKPVPGLPQMSEVCECFYINFCHACVLLSITSTGL